MRSIGTQLASIFSPHRQANSASTTSSETKGKKASKTKAEQSSPVAKNTAETLAAEQKRSGLSRLIPNALRKNATKAATASQEQAAVQIKQLSVTAGKDGASIHVEPVAEKDYLSGAPSAASSSSNSSDAGSVSETQHLSPSEQRGSAEQQVARSEQAISEAMAPLKEAIKELKEKAGSNELRQRYGQVKRDFSNTVSESIEALFDAVETLREQGTKLKHSDPALRTAIKELIKEADSNPDVENALFYELYDAVDNGMADDNITALLFNASLGTLSDTSTDDTSPAKSSTAESTYAFHSTAKHLYQKAKKMEKEHLAKYGIEVSDDMLTDPIKEALENPFIPETDLRENVPGARIAADLTGKSKANATERAQIIPEYVYPDDIDLPETTV